MDTSKINPILFCDSSEEDKKIVPNFNYFKSDKAVIPTDGSTEEERPAKKRGRPKKDQSQSNGVYVPSEGSSNLQQYQSNDSYMDTYNETNMLLKGAIVQIDTLASEIKTDIDSVRSSKTLKNKYRYITDMTGTTGSLIGAKVSAIKELNASITNAHNLDLKRAKDLSTMKAQDEQNDDKRIMDLYSAFVNTPTSSGAILGPSIQDTTLMGINGIVRADATPAGMGMDMGYSNYLNNLSPEQNRMRMESDPNVETVVVFNQDTGQRAFDVIDKNTGQSIPNYTRPDSFLLEDTSIDISRGIARNTQLDQTYKLVVIGSNPNITEY